MKKFKITTYLFLVLMFAAFMSNSQEQIPDWENPKMFNQNKEKAHATLMPFRTVDEALTQQRNQSVFYKSLSGIWKFNWVRKPADRPVDFFNPEYNVSDWDDIPVPANWELEGYGIPISYSSESRYFKKPVESLIFVSSKKLKYYGTLQAKQKYE